MYVDLRSSIGRRIWIKGEFDAAVFEPLVGALVPGGTMLDVGANVGYYSVLALDFVGVGGHVHAFEVDPRPLRCLRKTVKRFSLSELSIHEIAVGSYCGEAYLRQDSECGNSWISDNEVCGRRVRMTSLDAWNECQQLTRLDAMKIDVEGMELEVLRGAVDLIEAFRPVLVIEADFDHQMRNGTSFEQLTQWLTNHGYTWQHLPLCWTQTLVARPSERKQQACDFPV